MGFISNLKRFFITSGGNVIKKYEDKIACLEYELNRKTTSYQKVKNNLTEIQGEKRKLEHDIQELNDYILKLNNATEKALKENKEDLAKQSFNLMQQDKKRLGIYQNNIELINQVEEKVNKQLMIFENSIKETKTLIDTLKIKRNFSNSVNKINQSLDIDIKDFNNTELDNIINDIDKDYYVAEVKAENIEKASVDELNHYLNTDEFEKYKNKVLK